MQGCHTDNARKDRQNSTKYNVQRKCKIIQQQQYQVQIRAKQDKIIVENGLPPFIKMPPEQRQLVNIFRHASDKWAPTDKQLAAPENLCALIFVNFYLQAPLLNHNTLIGN